MACWSVEMTSIFRVLVNDLDYDSYTYSDDRVKTILLVAARYVNQEVNFSTNYTVDVGAETISPDPAASATLDNSFINLTVLKAACLTDQWSIRSRAAIEGITAKAGPASLNVKAGTASAGYKLLLDSGPCTAYNQMKMEYNMGNINIVKAVLSPFVSNNYDILNSTADLRR